MHPNAPLFFEKAPLALPLYAAFEAALLARFPDTEIRVQKTQISFSQRHGFACVSLPRRASERNAGALLVSFGLPYQAEHPRIMAAPEPYPGRWTHHVLLPDAASIDATLLGWIAEARAFALTKR